MKMNKRMMFGLVSIALAAVIALIGIPAVIGQSNSTVNIVRVKADIEKGTVITEEQVELVEVSTKGLPTGIATDTAQVVGMYALVDLVPGDYFLPRKVNSTTPEADPILKKLTGDKIAVSMSVQSLAVVLSNKLRTDDIVSIYTFVDGETVKPDELQYVRIIAISNSGGTSTLAEDLEVMSGNTPSGFFKRESYEIEQILKATGRESKFESVKTFAVSGFAVGCVLALLMGNAFLVPVFGIAFAYIPVFYVRSTAGTYSSPRWLPFSIPRSSPVSRTRSPSCLIPILPAPSLLLPLFRNEA